MYYITIAMLLVDPLYLSILCGFFGGGDMNGISLLVPEVVARIVYGIILAISAVYELWLSCKGMGLNDVDDSQSGITRFLARNPDTCFVAQNDGKLIGVIMAGNDGRRGYIYHTAVHPQYRKQGIGSDLVKTSLNALEQLGISKVALVVFERNIDGNAFWEKQCFTVRNDLTYRNKSLIEMVRIDT